MSLNDFFKKVESSDEFKSFKKQNPSAYFCAGFFVYDFDDKSFKKQLDYWDGEGVTTFIIDDKIIPQKEETFKKEKLEEIKKQDIKVDIDDAIKFAEKELKKAKQTPSKIIVILQTLKNEVIWNLTCISGFSLLRIHLNMNKKVLLNEKSSIIDMMRIEKGNKGKDNLDKSNKGKVTSQETEGSSKDAGMLREPAGGSSADYVG